MVSTTPSKSLLPSLLGLIVASLLLAGCEGASTPPSLLLAELSVEGASKAMFPAFDSKTKHYAVGCNAADVLTIRATAANSGMQVSINASQPTVATANEVVNPADNQDIVVDVSNEGLNLRYTLHCLAEDFPDVEILRSDPGATQELVLVSPSFALNGQRITYLTMMDNNGVPRFRQRIIGGAADFKRHANGQYSYALNQGSNQFGNRDAVVVVLDEGLNEIDRLTTVGLTQTDNHDFQFTDEGNLLFISYHSTSHDMSAFGLSANEIIGDSVIQEVTPAGNVVLQWSSWDHIEMADCVATGYPAYPRDYAHLNSLNLTADGDLIASFRGCGQVLKIDRPSGDVIWYLGGSRSDFIIVGDPFNEFCGQHTAMELSDNRVLMFDNGIFCIGERENVFGQFSRVLEYRLDSVSGQANFVRDYSLNGSYQELTRSRGSVQPIANGNWLMSWGNGPDMSVTEVNESGEEVFAMRLTSGGAIAISYRAFREPTLPIN